MSENPIQILESNSQIQSQIPSNTLSLNFCSQKDQLKKFDYLNIEKFILGQMNSEFTSQTPTQKTLSEISMTNEAIAFTTNSQKILISFYNFKNYQTINIDEFVHDKEIEILQISLSKFFKKNFLAVNLSSNKIFIFYNFLEGEELRTIKLPKEIQIDQKIFNLQWKKNHLIFQTEQNIFNYIFEEIPENQDLENVFKQIDFYVQQQRTLEIKEKFISIDYSQVTELYFLSKEKEIQIMNGDNSILFSFAPNLKENEKIKQIKGFRQSLKQEPLTLENLKTHSFELKDLIIAYSSEQFFHVYNVGKLKTKEENQFKISSFDLQKKFKISLNQMKNNYSQFYISSNNQYFVALNETLKHLICLKINQNFASAQNHQENFQNIFPFFENGVLFPFSENVSRINYVIGNGSEFTKKFFKQENKMELKEVIVIFSEVNNTYRFHMIPLDNVFKIAKDEEEKDTSKIELNEDSFQEKKEFYQKNFQNEKNQNQFFQEELYIRKVSSPVNNNYIEKTMKNENKKSDLKELVKQVQQNEEKKMVFKSPIEANDNTNKKQRKLKKAISEQVKVSDKIKKLIETQQETKEEQKIEKKTEEFQKGIEEVFKKFLNEMNKELGVLSEEITLEFTKSIGKNYYKEVQNSEEKVKEEFKKNNDLLITTIEKSLTKSFEDYTQELENFYTNNLKKLEIQIQMQKNLKQNFEGIFIGHQKTAQKLEESLKEYQIAQDQIQNQTLKEKDNEIQELKNTAQILNQNQTELLDQIQTLSENLEIAKNKLKSTIKQNFQNKTQNNLEDQILEPLQKEDAFLQQRMTFQPVSFPNISFHQNQLQLFQQKIIYQAFVLPS